MSHSNHDRNAQQGDFENVELSLPRSTTGFPQVRTLGMERDIDDTFSVHSNSPLSPQPTPPGVTYAHFPTPPHGIGSLAPGGHDHHLDSTPLTDQKEYNPFQADMPQPSHQTNPSRPTNSRNPSWDLLAGIRKFEHEYEEFDSRNASAAHLQYADGDLPKNKVCLLPKM